MPHAQKLHTSKKKESKTQNNALHHTPIHALVSNKIAEVFRELKPRCLQREGSGSALSVLDRHTTARTLGEFKDVVNQLSLRVPQALSSRMDLSKWVLVIVFSSD